MIAHSKIVKNEFAFGRAPGHLGHAKMLEELRQLKAEDFTAVFHIHELSGSYSEEEEAVKILEMDYDHYPLEDLQPVSEEDLETVASRLRALISKQKDKIAKGRAYVYVHCGAGQGRSPTVCAAYLILSCRSCEQAASEIADAASEDAPVWTGIDSSPPRHLRGFARRLGKT